MKTRIKKIIVMTVALLFLGVGVSFAHDGNRKHHKPRGNAHGHYKNGYDDHHGWHNKHHKPHRYTSRHYKKWHGHHGWHKKHYKHRRHHRERHVYKEVHHHYRDNHHRRRAPREEVVYKAVLKDPKMIFKIIVKDHGFF